MDIAQSLGWFRIAWGGYEEMLEIISQRLLKISPYEASIIFCDLGLNSKTEITLALIAMHKPAWGGEVSRLIRQIQSIARRNHLTHSGIVMNENLSQITFIKRENKGAQHSKPLTFSENAMHAHLQAVSNAAAELQVAVGLTNADVDAYFNAIYRSQPAE